MQTYTKIINIYGVSKSNMENLKENRKVLTGLLSAAIRGEACHLLYAGIDWQTIFDEAVQHQVMPLLYPLLVEIGGNIGVSETLLGKWRINALSQGIGQEQNYFGIENTLVCFSKAGIPVIVLKGLVLRELYPHPCLRTMGDVDLLVKPGDMEKAGRILVEAGYRMYSDKGKHTEYSHEILPYVELHRSMTHDGYFEKNTDFETEVWNRAVTVKVCGTTVLSLCPQDKVLYLSLHMAEHIVSSGFGLRQLCDFVVLIETYRSEIDWIELFSRAALCHIDIFLNVLLEACHDLFDLELPEIYQEYKPQDVSLVRSFIDDIFDGGVFGMNSTERITANRLLYYNSGNKAKGLRQKFHVFMSLLLPKAAKLDTRFDYAREHHLLLPIAWIHRICYIILRKDIEFAEKTAVLASGAPAYICSKRGALLRQLGLLD